MQYYRNKSVKSTKPEYLRNLIDKYGVYVDKCTSINFSYQQMVFNKVELKIFCSLINLHTRYGDKSFTSARRKTAFHNDDTLLLYFNTFSQNIPSRKHKQLFVVRHLFVALENSIQ